MDAKPRAGEPSRGLKLIVALSLALFLVGSSVLLVLGISSGAAARPGFLGTHAGLFSDLNLIAEVVLVLGLGVGFFLARRGKIAAHQYNQTGWALFNIVLTVFIMVMSYAKYVLPSFRENVAHPFGLVSTIHATLGLLAIICAVYLILHMNQLIPRTWRVSWWKQMMRGTLALYWMVGMLGLGVYYFWYVG